MPQSLAERSGDGVNVIVMGDSITEVRAGFALPRSAFELADSCPSGMDATDAGLEQHTTGALSVSATSISMISICCLLDIGDDK